MRQHTLNVTPAEYQNLQLAGLTIRWQSSMMAKSMCLPMKGGVWQYNGFHTTTSESIPAPWGILLTSSTHQPLWRSMVSDLQLVIFLFGLQSVKIESTTVKIGLICLPASLLLLENIVLTYFRKVSKQNNLQRQHLRNFFSISGTGSFPKLFFTSVSAPTSSYQENCCSTLTIIWFQICGSANQCVWIRILKPRHLWNLSITGMCRLLLPPLNC